MAVVEAIDDGRPANSGVLPSKTQGGTLPKSTILIYDKLNNAAKESPDKLAIASLHQPYDLIPEILDPAAEPAKYLRWNFQQLIRATDLIAVSLWERGIKKGDTVAVLMQSVAEFGLIWMVSLLLRCRLVPMSPLAVADPEQMNYMFNTVKPDVVITMNERLMMGLLKVAPTTMKNVVLKVVLGQKASAAHAVPDTVYLGDLVKEAAANTSYDAKLKELKRVEAKMDDEILVLFTSGTTSLPKACALTDLNFAFSLDSYVKEWVDGVGATANYLPLWHTSGCLCAIGWLVSGGACIYPSMSFNATAILAAIHQEKVSQLILVPSMIDLLVNDPNFSTTDLSSLQQITLGSTTILPIHIRRCIEELGASEVIVSYGMTEGVSVTIRHLKADEAQVDPPMYAMRGTRIKLCRPNSREIVPRGEPGEIHQGGYHCIKGYVGVESEMFYTDEDGDWIITGDQGIMQDDGGLRITGRYKELIIRGGINISPAKIEAVVARVLGLEAYVVAMPDEIAGEVPVAIINDKDMDTASKQAVSLRETLLNEMGPQFALDRFFTLSELGLKDFPRTSVGKAKKVELAKYVKKWHDEQVKEAEENSNQASETSTLNKLTTTWANISGVKDYNPEASVFELADSLMLAKYANALKKLFGQPISLRDIERYPTLAQQAKYLGSRQADHAMNEDLIETRPGPPVLDDIVFVDNEQDYEQLKRQCEAVLTPAGLSWTDVEDVTRPYDFLQSWVKPRLISDRLRSSYVATSAKTDALKIALEKAITHNDSFRALSVPIDSRHHATAIMRPSAKWFSKNIVVLETSVATRTDLEELIPADFVNPNQGVLLHAVIAHVEETNTAGFCILMTHSVFDAFALDTFFKDLDTALKDPKAKIEQHVPYKLWANHQWNTRESWKAKAAVKFNVNRLRGIRSNPNALWPPQRTRVWQRGCDKGLHITQTGELTTADNPKKRPLLDGPPSSCHGSDGLVRTTKLVDLSTLTSQHGVSGYIVMKAAFSLLETRLTKQNHALFCQTFAVRDYWPFVDGWVSRRLPSPLDVAGPTIQRVTDNILVDPNEPVLDFLLRLKKDQISLVDNAHAPYEALYDELNRQSGGGGMLDTLSSYITGGLAMGDGDVMEEVRRRTNLNWLPDFAQMAANRGKGPHSSFAPVASTQFNEVGLAIKCGLLGDQKTLGVVLNWDDGNIRGEEAKAWIDELVGYAASLGQKASWGLKVGDMYVKE